MPHATTSELSLQWPALGVCRVPYQVFTDPALYACEQERIFPGGRLALGRAGGRDPCPGRF
jgi:hypothetical protein